MAKAFTFAPNTTVTIDPIGISKWFTTTFWGYGDISPNIRRKTGRSYHFTKRAIFYIAPVFWFLVRHSTNYFCHGHAFAFPITLVIRSSSIVFIYFWRVIRPDGLADTWRTYIQKGGFGINLSWNWKILFLNFSGFKIHFTSWGFKQHEVPTFCNFWFQYNFKKHRSLEFGWQFLN